jgi:hypothetical protein
MTQKAVASEKRLPQAPPSDRGGAYMSSVEGQPPLNSPLISYALKGLERCWLSEHHRWSHVYHLDGRDHPNESLPRSDVFYTLNVLLGLSRVKQVPSEINIAATFEHNVLQLVSMPVAKYAFGVALWAAAELKLEVPTAVARRLKVLLSDKSNWWSFRAQDLGMILTGIIAQAKVNRSEWHKYAVPLFEFLIARYRGQSELFFDTPSGFRRRFASFASQTYLTLACYSYGEFANDLRAIEVAKACTQRLIELQGPNGEWPWFFDAHSGSIVDFYEVYSVHQYGMAPAFLECAERHGVTEARDALIRGFNWVLGQNQLAKPMLILDKHLTIRSQARKRELHTNQLRIARSVCNALLHRGTGLIDPAGVRMRLECRSYELGWILWSFGDRFDLPDLTHNHIFVGALQQSENFAG